MNYQIIFYSQAEEIAWWSGENIFVPAIGDSVWLNEKAYKVHSRLIETTKYGAIISIDVEL